MRKILVLFAHPRLDRSEIHAKVMPFAKDHPAVTFVDLYAEYPDFEINVRREQARLVEHDVILFQHPIFWYSTPSILKEWQDLVLEYGFAYGRGGDQLAGKGFGQIVSAGSAEEQYTKRGEKGASLSEMFSPFRGVARLCQMHYIPPMVLYEAAAALRDGRLESFENAYRDYLNAMADENIPIEKLNQSADFVKTVRKFLGV